MSNRRILARLAHVLVSIAIHMGILALSWCLVAPGISELQTKKHHFTVELSQEFKSSKGAVNSTSRHSNKPAQTRRYDLRPSFAKNSLVETKKSEQPENPKSTPLDIENEVSRDLLLAESKTFEAFDLLAERINRHLDYPLILAENDIQGFATLDLFFDNEGNVDEGKSKFSGSGRAIRGLLVKASRTGLTEWFLNEASRIRKNQFRNQHFRADFVITRETIVLAELRKSAANSYHLNRRRPYVSACLSIYNRDPIPDFACLAFKFAGVVKTRLSEEYKAKFQALKDNLEQFDLLGLNGIMDLIRNRNF